MRHLAFLMLVVLAGCATTGSASRHGFDDADAWAQSFDDPARDQWQKPDEVLKALNLPPTAYVAEVGSATGYFTTRLARAVPQGQVFGCDVESSMTEYLGKRAEKEGLTNLTPVLATADDAKIPNKVDAVLVVNTVHYIDARPAYFAKLANALSPGARVAIIDFTPESSMGPPRETKVSASQLQKEMEDAGYALEQSLPLLPEQFFLIFVRHR